MIDDITLFIHIVERRSLAGGAKSLNLPPATATRRLKKLEHSLGCRLIHRSARKFVLTAEGNSYYQAFSGLVKQFEETARNLRADIHQLKGPLKVLAPTNISIGILQPMWSKFISDYPEIQLDLQTNNVTEDILSSQVDLALRIGPQQDSSLFQKRLGAVSTILIASPDYLSQRGSPDTVNDLQVHKLITTDTLPAWRLLNTKTKQEEVLYPQGDLILNDIYLAAQMVIDGLGVALLPTSEVYNELDSGKLVRVLSPWRGPERTIYAIWPSGRLLSAKAQTLRDYMAEYIRNTKILQTEI
ncbi:LysR family transcriptional regulator [Alphaproteobacteria bacterium 46_93_T64]|nr:LysR family transcriptional regulator [Alphaproteobacteria bacterium 46_93_T64]